MLAKSLNKYVETNLKEQNSAILFTCDVLLLHRLYLAMMFSHHLTTVQRYFFLWIEIRILIMNRVITSPGNILICSYHDVKTYTNHSYQQLQWKQKNTSSLSKRQKIMVGS